ncbi:sporulation protein YunB [Paenisporosarcina cavernae]|uniref:sporulation protein YunB n=1 Tax=Paenisporosarcina cavernae TaxID=2320858 RepID=UPI001EE5D132|nr:sporulation protein YunB [Paenisporosarcina cavernae]
MFVRSRRSFKQPLKTRFAFLVVSFLLSVALLFVWINHRLTPTYLQYAEIQTSKIAAHVISKAINDRISNVLDVNDIIEHVPSEQSNMMTTKFNTEIINRVQSDTAKIVQTHLEQAEKGNMDYLPYLTDVEYDQQSMEQDGGIVFFVPLGQAANLPLLGNIGPKVPIRFHVVGNVESKVDSTIREFGINNAFVEVNIVLKVNVQIIVPMATSVKTLEQKIPVALGLIQGQVPQIFNRGDGVQPSIEVPIQKNE